MHLGAWWIKATVQSHYLSQTIKNTSFRTKCAQAGLTIIKNNKSNSRNSWPFTFLWGSLLLSFSLILLSDVFVCVYFHFTFIFFSSLFSLWMRHPSIHSHPHFVLHIILSFPLSSVSFGHYSPSPWQPHSPLQVCTFYPINIILI